MTRSKKPVRCVHCGKLTSPIAIYLVAGRRLCYEAAREAAAAGQV
jgi:hypothetical protein